MEGRKSPTSPTIDPAKVSVKLNSPKSCQSKLSTKPKNTSKINALKAKVYYDKMQQLRQTPTINKISREIAYSSTHKSPPKSPYAKKILSNNRFIKSISSASTKSYASCTDFQQFAILNKNVNIKLTPKLQSPIVNRSKSDIFTRGIFMLKKKEQSLEFQRKQSFDATLEQCTFSPKIKKTRSTSSFSRSKSVRSTPTSLNGNKLEILREKSESISYKSFSPTPRQYSFAAGCNLEPVKENGSPMFRYLALKMPYP
ncbi:hypothetical protein SteCoe_12363 [Stentor coeruleus]|uniref:Uncharacterized protein n=1 Tax=Stentor coeruleus TaxID=5963 RepID=A0A1R2CAY4_9CILI|nr:hypothetical protein SteCoe_12363 [Stentor coeruleus]